MVVLYPSHLTARFPPVTPSLTGTLGGDPPSCSLPYDGTVDSLLATRGREARYVYRLVARFLISFVCFSFLSFCGESPCHV